MNFCTSTYPDSPGPLSDVWRREVLGKGEYGTWQQLTWTCFPNTVPASTGPAGTKAAPPKPVLTTAMIREAWRHTTFAKPSFTMQPPHGVTLIRLKTYFQVHWPDHGFQPGEIDTPPPAEMLGHTVRIRPTLVGYTYHFGDGSTTGPTTSPGGTYPHGDITHAYPTKGTYHPQVTATYGGEFSVDGSAWIPIPDTLDITGPAGTLHVKTAHAHLVSH